MTKKHINVQLETVEFYGDLDQSIKLLHDFKKQYSKDHGRLYLAGGMESYQYENSEHYVLRLVGTRLENDEEYAARQVKEEEQKNRWAENERKQYEALKKKFEGEGK